MGGLLASPEATGFIPVSHAPRGQLNTEGGLLRAVAVLDRPHPTKANASELFNAMRTVTGLGVNQLNRICIILAESATAEQRARAFSCAASSSDHQSAASGSTAVHPPAGKGPAGDVVERRSGGKVEQESDVAADSVSVAKRNRNRSKSRRKRNAQAQEGVEKVEDPSDVLERPASPEAESDQAILEQPASQEAEA